MAAASSSLQQPSDSWDVPYNSSISRRVAPVTSGPVRDDWDDDDDDDDEPQNEQDNQRIWDNANAKAPTPMPELIISPSATSTHSVTSPPPSVFQPAMRILKRPTAGSANTRPSPPTSASAESLREREVRYQAARERIFGPESGSDNNNSSQSLNANPKRLERAKGSPQQVVRSPRGPISENGIEASENFVPRGFGGQRAKPPPPHSPNPNLHGAAETTSVV